MTTIDWIIVAFTALMAFYGYMQGFIVGALSLAGFAVGAFLATRLAPALLPNGSHSPYAPLFGLAGALFAGGILAGGLEAVGVRIRDRLRLPGVGLVDGIAGGALTACVALGIVWIAGAVALQTPGARGLRPDVQRSAILRALNSLLPPSGPILNALARFDPLPAFRGPEPRLAAPDPALLRRPGVRAAAPSVVRILGTACGLGVEGSGWVAGPGLVVTNAHVVAGESDTGVEVGGHSPTLSAHVVHYDSRNDVAVLRVGGLAQRALSLAPHPAADTAGAILGYPHDGPFDVRAARIGATQTVLSDDAYGQGPVRRSLTPVRGLIRSGNSGGPVVDGHGRVLATVFAATVGGPAAGGYGVPNPIVAGALRSARSSGPVSTGPCAR